MTIIPIQPPTRETTNSKKSTRTRPTIAKKTEAPDPVNDGKARSEIRREFPLASSTLLQFTKDEKKFGTNPKKKLKPEEDHDQKLAAP